MYNVITNVLLNRTDNIKGRDVLTSKYETAVSFPA